MCNSNYQTGRNRNPCLNCGRPDRFPWYRCHSICCLPVCIAFSMQSDRRLAGRMAERMAAWALRKARINIWRFDGHRSVGRSVGRRCVARVSRSVSGWGEHVRLRFWSVGFSRFAQSAKCRSKFLHCLLLLPVYRYRPTWYPCTPTYR